MPRSLHPPWSTGPAAPVLAYAAVAALFLWPWLAHATLFASDQYVHAYTASTLADWLRGGDALADWFVLNRFPEPNWLGHGYLAVTHALTELPVPLLEKAFPLALAALSGYAFLGRGGLAGRFRGGAARWRAALAMVALAFWFGGVWQLGFVNYQLGMAGCLAGLTATDLGRRHRRWGVPAWALLLYACHPIPLLLFAGMLGLAEWQRRRDGAGPAGWLRSLPATLATGAWWFGLPVLLLAAYAARNAGLSTYQGASPWRLLGLVYQHHDLTVFAAAEEPYAKGVVLAAVIAASGGLWRLLSVRGPELVLAAALVAVPLAGVLLAPDYLTGGALIHQRLMPFVFVAGLYAARGLRPGPSVQFGSAAASGLLVLGITAARIPAAARVADVLDEWAAFAKTLPAGASVLAVGPAAHGSSSLGRLAPKPMLHHYGPASRRYDLVWLDTYEAFVGYFPLRWRTGRSPYEALSRRLDAQPAYLDPEGEAWFARHVDYVASVREARAGFTPATWRWVAPYLETEAASPSGTFRLYRVRGR